MSAACRPPLLSIPQTQGEAEVQPPPSGSPPAKTGGARTRSAARAPIDVAARYRKLVQTARAGGIRGRGRFMIGALEELRERSDRALDALSGEIGAGLPAEVVGPVAAGVRSRAELIGEDLLKGASEDFS